MNIQVDIKHIPPQRVAQPKRAAAWACVKVDGVVAGEMTQTYVRDGKKYTNETKFWFKPYNYSGERSTELISGDTAENAVKAYIESRNRAETR